jgi:hypothetical protein
MIRFMPEAKLEQMALVANWSTEMLRAAFPDGNLSREASDGTNNKELFCCMFEHVR